MSCWHGISQIYESNIQQRVFFLIHIIKKIHTQKLEKSQPKFQKHFANSPATTYRNISREKISVGDNMKEEGGEQKKSQR